MPGLAWARRGMQLAHWISPSAAAVMADELFFRPIKAKVRPEEAAELARGRELHFFVKGTRVTGWAWGTGPSVLLVHGWAGHSGQMTGLVPALTAAGFRVVAVDMPAHGRSEGATSSIVHFADAIAAAHETVGPFVAAVGHSLGAGGLTLALSRGLPLRRVVFVAPPADLEQFWSRFRQGLSISPDVWQRMQARAEARLGILFSEVVPLRHAPAMAAPLLAFHDEGDREIPLTSGAELVEAWPGARMITTQGLGHVRILKDTGVAAQTSDFLRR